LPFPFDSKGYKIGLSSPELGKVSSYLEMNRIQIPFVGPRAFNLLWLSQSLSLLGTGMTRFALLIWAYQVAGTATALAMLGFSITVTYVIASPFAGVFVDRWDRRKVMFFTDLGAGLMTFLLLILYLCGLLQIWHLFLAEAVAGVMEAFQEPAFSASVSLLVPRETYTRANARLGLGKSAARILAPAIAGLMLNAVGLSSVMLADLGTMVLALLSLVIIFIPEPQPSPEGQVKEESFGRQLLFGFRYIYRRPGLRGLLFIFFLIHLFATLTYFGVLSPMILARTGGDELALGTVQTVMGLGGIVGGLIVSMRSAIRHKTRVFLVSTILSFLIGDFLMAVSRSTPAWALAGFIAEFSIPFIVSPYFAIWQELVPTDVQGKVFATREMVQVSSQPFGYLAAGFLADRVFEPAMRSGGLGNFVGMLVGTGTGAGMSAMFLCTSILGALTGLLGLLTPSIRKVERQSDELNVDKAQADLITYTD
jgi:DHA3 family macrolide efflux protein-like MFS transporter